MVDHVIPAQSSVTSSEKSPAQTDPSPTADEAEAEDEAEDEDEAENETDVDRETAVVVGVGSIFISYWRNDEDGDGERSTSILFATGGGGAGGGGVRSSWSFIGAILEKNEVLEVPIIFQIWNF